MRTARQRLFARAVCLLVGACLFGCGTVEKVIEPKEDAVFRKYYTAECGTLNYLTTNLYADTSVSANVIDCLVDYDEFGNIVPGLAESWSSNEDMTEWTFCIRKGVKWVSSVGSEYAEVTADDWVAAAEYVNNAFNNSACRYMYTSGSEVHGAREYFEYTKYLRDSDYGALPNDSDGHPFIIPAETTPEDIGVKAKDKYTLVYTLDEPCSFFPSQLCYTAFMPVNRKFLEEEGENFALDNKHLLYNGAYLLAMWSPLEQRVMGRNDSYWDKDKVYIDRIEEYYNPDAYEIQADMYLKGEVDEAQLTTAELEQWLGDSERRKLVHPDRPDNSYSYFYCFNFDPQFSERYERKNWRIAVNNETFRKAVAAALDRRAIVALYDPYDVDRLVSDTITPKDFVSVNGTDYTAQEQFSFLTGYDKYAAVRYAELARAELAAEGAKLPIKMLVPYDPMVLGWQEESELIKEQLESTLGKDLIEVIPEASTDTDFIGEVREKGNYAFLKCSWGADYIDPETFTQPFESETLFNFWNKGGTEAATDYNNWLSLKRKASGVTGDTAERFSCFADAERLLIEHAIAVPVSVECSGGYVASKLDRYEGEYATCGIAMQRYKLMHLNETSYSIEDSERRYAKWQADKAEKAKENSTK